MKDGVQQLKNKSLEKNDSIKFKCSFMLTEAHLFDQNNAEQLADKIEDYWINTVTPIDADLEIKRGKILSRDPLSLLNDF